MSNGRQFRSDVLQAIYDKYIGHDPESIARFELCRLAMDVAMSLRDLRESSGMTQIEVGDRCGMKASSISRLENTNYEGHTLSGISRIAAAMGYRAEIKFVPRNIQDAS